MRHPPCIARVVVVTLVGLSACAGLRGHEGPAAAVVLPSSGATAAPAATRRAAADAPAAVHGAPSVQLETAQQEQAGYGVMFWSGKPIPEGRLTVVQVGGSYLRTVSAQVVEKDADGRWYEAGLSEYPVAASRGHSDVAIIVPQRPQARLVKLGPSDREALTRLTSPDFADVIAVYPNAVALDGGPRPDLAFVEVCVEYPRGDGICGTQEVYATRRGQHGWTPIACGDLACFPSRGPTPVTREG